MSIATTGQAKAQNMKTSQVVPAGFIKNDASGNFSFGNAGSAWTLLETKTVPAGPGVTSLSFTGLTGVGQFAYRLIWENPYDVSTPVITDARIFVRRNGVTASTDYLVINLSGAAAVTTTSLVSTLGHGLSNIIVPPAAPPFFMSGLWEYAHNPVNNDVGLDVAGGKISHSKMVACYPSIPRIDGAWVSGAENNAAANTTTLDIVAAQALLLRPGSVWSLYKIVLA